MRALRSFSAAAFQSPEAYLVSDRSTVVPPLRMERQEAEELFKAPDCRVPKFDASLVNDPHAFQRYGEEAQRKNAECASKTERFQKGLMVDYPFHVQGATAAGSGYLVEARLVEASVYSPHGELLRSFQPSELEDP